MFQNLHSSLHFWGKLLSCHISYAKRLRTINTFGTSMQNNFPPLQSLSEPSFICRRWVSFSNQKGSLWNSSCVFGAQTHPWIFILIINTRFPSIFHKSLREQHRFACLHLPSNDCYAISVLNWCFLPLYDRAAGIGPMLNMRGVLCCLLTVNIRGLRLRVHAQVILESLNRTKRLISAIHTTPLPYQFNEKPI